MTRSGLCSLQSAFTSDLTQSTIQIAAIPPTSRTKDKLPQLRTCEAFLAPTPMSVFQSARLLVVCSAILSAAPLLISALRGPVSSWRQANNAVNSFLGPPEGSVNSTCSKNILELATSQKHRASPAQVPLCSLGAGRVGTGAQLWVSTLQGQVTRQLGQSEKGCQEASEEAGSHMYRSASPPPGCWLCACGQAAVSRGDREPCACIAPWGAEHCSLQA